MKWTHINTLHIMRQIKIDRKNIHMNKIETNMRRLLFIRNPIHSHSFSFFLVLSQLTKNIDGICWKDVTNMKWMEYGIQIEFVSVEKILQADSMHWCICIGMRSEASWHLLSRNRNQSNCVRISPSVHPASIANTAQHSETQKSSRLADHTGCPYRKETEWRTLWDSDIHSFVFMRWKLKKPNDFVDEWQRKNEFLSMRRLRCYSDYFGVHFGRIEIWWATSMWYHASNYLSMPNITVLAFMMMLISIITIYQLM